MSSTPILRAPGQDLPACLVCGRTPLALVLSLGELRLPAFPEPDQAPAVQTAPIDLYTCDSCGLAQLGYQVEPDLLYRQYWYRSGINETMRAELADVVDCALTRCHVTMDSVVIDIGANDGTLLNVYKRLDGKSRPWLVAYEPAKNLQPQVDIRRGYFPDGHGLDHHAAIITSIACFYDTTDPIAFIREIDRLLTKEGLWILQLQDLAGMVRTTAFDNLCHEHVTYWSLHAFEQALHRAAVDLQVTEVEPRQINGGSLRIYVRRTHTPVSVSVQGARDREAPWIGWRALEQFAWRAGQVQEQLRHTLTGLTNAGVTVDLYAASTKANTLLQTAGIGPHLLRQAWERSPEKVGRETATGIPIVSEETGRANPPAVLLVGAYQFRDAFLARERAYLEAGGTMIVPLPVLDIITAKLGGAATQEAGR